MTNPDMRKGRVDGGFTIPSQDLRDDRRNCHGDSDETVLKDPEEDDVEPGQSTPGRAQKSGLSSGAPLKPVERPHPRFG